MLLFFFAWNNYVFCFWGTHLCTWQHTRVTISLQTIHPSNLAHTGSLQGLPCFWKLPLTSLFLRTVLGRSTYETGNFNLESHSSYHHPKFLATKLSRVLLLSNAAICKHSPSFPKVLLVLMWDSNLLHSYTLSIFISSHVLVDMRLPTAEHWLQKQATWREE